MSHHRPPKRWISSRWTLKKSTCCAWRSITSRSFCGIPTSVANENVDGTRQRHCTLPQVFATNIRPETLHASNNTKAISKTHRQLKCATEPRTMQDLLGISWHARILGSFQACLQVEKSKGCTVDGAASNVNRMQTIIQRQPSGARRVWAKHDTRAITQRIAQVEKRLNALTSLLFSLVLLQKKELVALNSSSCSSLTWLSSTWNNKCRHCEVGQHTLLSEQEAFVGQVMRMQLLSGDDTEQAADCSSDSRWIWYICGHGCTDQPAAWPDCLRRLSHTKLR